MISFITRPIRNITGAVVMPFKALFVIALTGTINAMTYHGHWWFKWVAFGMGIAVLVALARGLRSLIGLVLVAWVGSVIYRRYGAQARQRFDQWAAGAAPRSAQVPDALRTPRAATWADRPAA